jgi:hypothetical protein
MSTIRRVDLLRLHGVSGGSNIYGNFDIAWEGVIVLAMVVTNAC